VPGALFMMAAKTEIKNYMSTGMGLKQAIASANVQLCANNDAGMFVTVWAATLDYESGELTYVNAGHNPPLLRHKGEWVWLKEKGGLFLGTFDTAKYKQAKLELEGGDELLLYTDGVNEAFSPDEEEYGNDRLESLLAQHVDLPPKLLVDVVRADVRSWAKGAEQSDDITMLCLEYGRQPEASGTFRVPADSSGREELVYKLHFEFSHLRCPAHVQAKIDVVTKALFSTLCAHGRAGASGQGEIEFNYQYDNEPRSLTMCLTAGGDAFDPLAYEQDEGQLDQTLSNALAYMDDAAYVRDGDDNVVAFRKLW
jgi:hypothetical protein